MKTFYITLTRVLEKEGYGLYAASSGEEAVEIFKKELIDLVLLDLKLPKMSGMAVLDKLKDYDPDCLVLMMTGLTDPKPAIEAMKMGAYDYLMKPFELEEVKLVVRKALETHELKREVARLRRRSREREPHRCNFRKECRYRTRLNKSSAWWPERPKTSVLIQGESGTGKGAGGQCHPFFQRPEKRTLYQA